MKAGKLKALGVTLATRMKQLPGVPMIAEAGVPGFEVTSWVGLWAPASTPPNIVRKLDEEVVRLLELRAARESIESREAISHPETAHAVRGFHTKRG